MVILEVILAVCGILCIAASFLLTEDEQKTSEQAKQPEKTVLSDGQKEEMHGRSYLEFGRRPPLGYRL